MAPIITYREQTWRFESGDRFVRSWLASDAQTKELPVPIVIGVIHGLGDHGGRFDGMAQWFATRGIHVYCFDQVGHGKTPGSRMVIPSYEFMLQDIDAFLQRLEQEHTGSCVGLFGQSMGGNLVLNHQLRSYSKAALIVASSPMLRAVNAPGPLQMMALRLLAKFAPHLRLSTEANPALLSRDPDAQRAFLEDPLVQRQITLRLGGALIDSGRWAVNNAENLTTPTLVTHGDADRITCHEASMEFAEKSQGRSDLKIWPDGPHDLHHDIVRDEFLQHIFEWILNQATTRDSTER